MKKNSLKRRMRAISIQQPYVEQIFRGTKRYEYRYRQTHIRERVYIYASLKPGDRAGFKKLGKEPGELPTGVILGTVEIASCKYFPESGDYGYVLKNPKRLKRPIAPTYRAQPCWFYPF